MSQHRHCTTPAIVSGHGPGTRDLGRRVWGEERSRQDIDTSIVTDEAAAVSTTSTSILYLSLSLLFICSKLFLCFADKWSECAVAVILEVSATVLTTGDPP